MKSEFQRLEDEKRLNDAIWKQMSEYHLNMISAACQLKDGYEKVIEEKTELEQKLEHAQRKMESNCASKDEQIELERKKQKM